MDNNNLIELVMIVKDSGDKIKDTLKSWLPISDYWTILDTGSTDGTQENIRVIASELKVPGELFEEPFEGFDVSRNRALALAKKNCEYLIMPDDTYIIINPELLRRKLIGQKNGKQYNGFFLDIHGEVDGIPNSFYVYQSTRIARTKGDYKWIRPIHETWDVPEVCNATLNSDCYIVDAVDDYHRKRSLNRYASDLKLLMAEYKKTTDPVYTSRLLSYLGETCLLLKDKKKAMEYFTLRVTEYEKIGSINEVYHALIKLGMLIAEKENENKEADIGQRPLERSDIACAQTPTENLNTEVMSYFNKAIKKVTLKDAYYYAAIYLAKSPENFPLTYMYAKRGFELPYNITASETDFSIATIKLPELLLKLSLRSGDHDLSKKCIEILDKYNPNDNVNIIKKLLLEVDNNTPKSNNNDDIHNRHTAANNNENTIVFVTNSVTTGPWDGNSINRGSETMIKTVAEKLADNKDFKVLIFCEAVDKSSAGIKIKQVTYIDKKHFLPYLEHNQISYLIIVRYASIFLEIRPWYANILHCYYWLHDTEIAGGSVVLPQNCFRKIICVSEWHKKIIKTNYGIPDNFINTINNCLPDEIKSMTTTRDTLPNSFIYSSDPSRGLINLLKIFPSILKKFPDATLNICCNLEEGKNDFIFYLDKRKAKKELKYITEKIKEINEKGTNPCINVLGLVGKKTLYEVFSKSEYWLYPTEFLETFCISAIEAQYHRCKIISTVDGALAEVLGKDSGNVILSEADMKNIIQGKLPEDLFERPFDLDKGRKNAEKYLAEKIKQDWLDLFKIK